MKGQISYIIKPLTLIMIIILILFLVQSLYSYRGREKLSEKNLDLTSFATNILLILANSEDCLAYRVAETEGAYANIVDLEKLEEFSQEYSDIEPDCARNYDFGWRVNVEEVNNKVFNGGREWSFGAKGFSKDKALRNKIEFWMPVAIRHSENEVNVGRMSITLVDGELEKLAGFFDWSCQMGKMGRMSSSSTEMMIDQPITYENNELCMGNSCRILLCELVYFDEFGAKGTYSISVNYQPPNKLLVSR